MQIELIKFSYPYMEYEKELQKRELVALLPAATVLSDSKNATVIQADNVNLDYIKELTYYQAFKIDNSIYYTRQGLLEQDETLRVTKQHTRYSTHGLHEYKGKFNPQIVRAISNIFGIKKGHMVLDPFDGSGTTILECAHAGIDAFGTDINPMACFIANAKVSALRIDPKATASLLNKLKTKLSAPCSLTIGDNDERLKYLDSWIPKETLCILETLLKEIETEDSDVRMFLLVVASDLIRDYSYQEPSDLRIRRRKTPFPKTSFLEAYFQNADKYLKRIEQVQALDGCASKSSNIAINCDIKKDNPYKNVKFDAAITSPPYVTALPYIDTQRISLVWLGLCDASEIATLEASLIGSREILKCEKNKWENIIDENKCALPNEIYELVCSMNSSLNEKDGFRRQAVPALTYKYFAEMKAMFANVKSMLKENGLYGLVVGHNKTTLGGKEYCIDTPYLLAVLAKECGWEVEELFPLQTYKRYGLNSKNAINKETLVVLRNV